MRFALIATALILSAAPLAAAESAAPQPKVGQTLRGASNTRLGVIDKVLADGSVRVIVDERFVVIPAGTLTVADGKVVTSLSKAEVSKLN